MMYLFSYVRQNCCNQWVNVVSHEKLLSSVSRENVACNFIEKEILTQMFSCEFCKDFKNTFFYRTPLVAACVWTKIIFFLTENDSRREKEPYKHSKYFLPRSKHKNERRKCLLKTTSTTERRNKRIAKQHENQLSFEISDRRKSTYEEIHKRKIKKEKISSRWN